MRDSTPAKSLRAAETAVGDRKIGGEKRPPIIFVTAEVDHRGSRRRDEQSAVARDFIDRLARCPAEKPDAENRVDLHSGEWRVTSDER